MRARGLEHSRWSEWPFNRRTASADFRNAISVEAGSSQGHIHVRIPDESPSSDPARLAASNAELVKKIVDVCDRYGRRPATVGEARGILGLRVA